MRPVLPCLFLSAAALPLAAQDAAEPARLVAQLAGPGRGPARAQLVALGGKAVPALIDALGNGDTDAFGEVLLILCEIGPDAAPAAARLKACVLAGTDRAAEILWALSELAPYAGADVDLRPTSLQRELVRLWLRDGIGSRELSLAQQRLRM